MQRPREHPLGRAALGKPRGVHDVHAVGIARDDAEVVRSEAIAARQGGFGGKLCIHPQQVAVVNACFRPSAEEIAWAQRIRDAAHAAAGAAVAVDGKMVDRPVLELAERILAQAQQ